MKEPTKEERIALIAKRKIEEAQLAEKIKAEGIVLKRDSCPECQKIWAEGDEGRNLYGHLCYCSQAHAQEYYRVIRDRATMNDKEQVFKLAYEAGKNGASDRLADHREISELLDEIENRWY